MGMWVGIRTGGNLPPVLIGLRTVTLKEFLKFTLFLPNRGAMAFEVSSPIASLPAKDASCRTVTRGDEVVLVVADEYSIGRMLVGVFSRAGIHVVWQGGLLEALDWLRENPSRVGAIFVDCHQTGGEGRDFSLRARALKAGIPVFLAGGNDTQESVAALVACGMTRWVPKPYLPTEVAWQVRSVVIGL